MAEGVQYGLSEEKERRLGMARSGALQGIRRRLVGEPMFKRFGDNQDSFASNSELAPTRLGMAVEEQWPAFKLVGFGFYYAWIWISYNSNVLVSPGAAYLPPDTISQTYLFSTLALSLALVALSIGRRFTEKMMERVSVAVVASLVAGLATVGLYAASAPRLPARCWWSARCSPAWALRLSYCASASSTLRFRRAMRLCTRRHRLCSRA